MACSRLRTVRPLKTLSCIFSSIDASWTGSTGRQAAAGARRHTPPPPAAPGRGNALRVVEPLEDEPLGEGHDGGGRYAGVDVAELARDDAVGHRHLDILEDGLVDDLGIVAHRGFAWGLGQEVHQHDVVVPGALLVLEEVAVVQGQAFAGGQVGLVDRPEVVLEPVQDLLSTARKRASFLGKW